ncbi:hypothetical protein [Aminobacter sp. BE322]|uniref:hypothetical protein n=1 Tax=unclassified Aminobacter TaxID=2644704 RepID=UPI003D1BA6D4
MSGDRYPGIVRAALEIAYDNGGINRFRPETKMRKEFADFLERQPQEILPAIDAWLTGLSTEDLETVCCASCEPEGEALMAKAPPFTDQLLNDYFDEVC